MWKFMGLLLKENCLWRCWDCLFLLNWIGVLTLSVLLKLPPRKLAHCSMKFFLTKLLFVSINLLYGLAWNIFAMFEVLFSFASYLHMLNKLQKLVCRALCPSIIATLKPLAHCQNVTSLSLIWTGWSDSTFSFLWLVYLLLW